MSSGEVLFILAFIVLPTAILVSSLWLAIFIYRRPGATSLPTEPARETDDEPTAVFATTDEAEVDPADEPPVTEHDVIVITDDDPLAASAVQEEQPDTIEPVAEAPQAEDEPTVSEIPEFQRTEDLDDVVTALQEIDMQSEPEDVVEPVAVQDAEPPAEEPYEEPPAEEPEQETFSETSELPVIDQAPPPPAEDETPEPEETVRPERPRNATGWRRRKESVKLLPGDPDMPRNRWRNRDPQRQVPQIPRPSRRRDDISRNPPPDHEPDRESPADPD